MEDLKSVASKWFRLGTQLDFENASLKQIKKDVDDVDDKIQDCFQEVICKWMDGPAEKRTLQVLADAVEKCDHARLANHIREKGMQHIILSHAIR